PRGRRNQCGLRRRGNRVVRCRPVDGGPAVPQLPQQHGGASRSGARGCGRRRAREVAAPTRLLSPSRIGKGGERRDDRIERLTEAERPRRKDEGGCERRLLRDGGPWPCHGGAPYPDVPRASVHVHHPRRHARRARHSPVLLPQDSAVRGPEYQELEAARIPGAGLHRPSLLRESMGLASFFEKKGDKGIVIFAGKGGLGKTTCSAGLSHYMASKRKRNVLCFSTDPQASLSDIFDRDIFGKGLVSVIPNLDVVEIDADRRVADYQNEVKQKILTMYGLSELPAEIEEYIDSTSAEPAMYESATYDAMADLVSTSGHDLYVFDMPPFGHGVRMIAM